MYLVFDWNKTKVFGPFETKDQAEEWLAKQGIYIGQYEDQEVSVMAFEPAETKLEMI